jgi:hypothetical protein
MQCTTWKLGPISVYRTRLGSPRVRSERLSHRMEDVPRFEARASELSPLDGSMAPKSLIYKHSSFDLLTVPPALPTLESGL